MFVFFLFKQKTAYELRISDLSSDVCSSDLFAQIIVHVVIKLVVIGVIEPIEPAHLVGTVIGAVAGAETAVIGLHIQAVGRVHGSQYRENRLARGVITLLASHRLVHYFNIIGIFLVNSIVNSEKRRVGKEVISTLNFRWVPYHQKKQ